MNYDEYADYWGMLTTEQKQEKVITWVERYKKNLEYYGSTDFEDLVGKYVEFITTEFKWRTLKVDKLNGKRGVRVIDQIKGEKGTYIRRWIPREVIVGCYPSRRQPMRLREVV